MSQEQSISPEAAVAITLAALLGTGIYWLSQKVGVSFEHMSEFILAAILTSFVFLGGIALFRSVNLWWGLAFGSALLTFALRMFRSEKLKHECNAYFPCELPLYLEWPALTVLGIATALFAVLSIRRFLLW